MSETILIITLVSTIVMPIVTTIATGLVYALRKMKKSSCCGASFESEDDAKTPVTNPEIKLDDIDPKQMAEILKRMSQK